MSRRAAVVCAVVAFCFLPLSTSFAIDFDSGFLHSGRFTAHSRNVARPARAASGSQRAGAPERAVSVPDGAGGAYVAWNESARDNMDADIILFRLTSTGAAAPGWPADGLPICTVAGDQFFAGGPPRLVSDDANGVIVCWTDGRSSHRVLDAYAQRVNSSGVPQWAANGVKYRTGVVDFDEQFAPDGTGGFVAVWSTMGTADLDIFATRVNGSGAVPSGWSTSGVAVCTATGDQDYPVLIGDGSGGAIVAWDDGRAGGNIYAQHMNSAGVAQWTADGNLVDGGGGTTPRICSDGGTGALVFWTGAEVDGQHLNSAGAEQWTAGGVPVDGSTDGSLDACVRDGAGGAFLTWSDFLAGSEYGQHVNSAGAAQWGSSGATILASGGLYATSFEIIPDGTGAAYFVWDDTRDYLTSQDLPETYAQRIGSNGSTAWAATGVKVSAPSSGPYRGFIQTLSASLSGSDLLVAWSNQAWVMPEIYAQRLNTSGSAQLGGSGATVFRYPGVQVGGGLMQMNSGGVFALVFEPQGGHWWGGTMRLARFNSDGSVAGATTISSAAVYGRLGGAIDDGSGGVIVAWTDRRNGNDDIYAQRFDASGSPLWTANGVAVCTATGVQAGGLMVSDGAGGVILSWSDSRNGQNNPDIYAQRLNSSGVPQWTADGVAVCNDLGIQYYGSMVSDGAGGAILAWNDLRNQPTSVDVYAQRIDGSGAAQWAANGLGIVSYPALTFSLPAVSLVPGAANDAIVLLAEHVDDPISPGIYDPSHTIVRAQKINSAGATQWGAGIAVTDASADCYGAEAIEDGSGGFYEVWTDDRSSAFDLYMQRFNASGTAQWTAGGVTICNSAGRQFPGGLTRDPVGDLYLSWTDTRNGLPDIYAQRVNTSGVPQWTANGVQVCGAARGQYLATLAAFKTASPGRVYVGWADNRAGDARYLYLQRLDLNGNPQWTANGVTKIALSLVSAEADPGRVRLTWFASDYVSATVERRTQVQDWMAIGTVRSDGTGLITFEDREVAPGTRYGYRLSFFDEGQPTFGGETWVDVPLGLAFALDGFVPNPATDHVWVSFTLPTADAAWLDLIDVAGRRIASRDLTGLTPGRHTLRLDQMDLRAGMYFLRLTQNGRSITKPAAVLR